MNANIKPLEVVALLEDIPAHGLVRGQVATVVELLPGNAIEVEFADETGRTSAQIALRPEQVMVLRDRPGMVA